MPTNRIYLDNAATSWPKPESVYAAVNKYQREIGAAAGRGAYTSASAASQILSQTRTSLANLLNAPVDSDLVFTFSGTDSLNLCILGSLKQGDKVVVTVAEHNSVLRPLSHLRQTRGVTIEYILCDEHGVADLDSARNLVTPGTALVVASHASNVTGAIQPIVELGEIAHAAGARFLVDAAQTAGHLKIDLSNLPVDMLASSGHKGLMGPLGTGFVWFAPGIAEQTTPLRFGGTGTSSESDEQPASGPERFESGNQNVAALAGLHAGVNYVRDQLKGTAVPAIQAADILHRLGKMDHITTYGPDNPEERVSLISFNVAGYDCHDVAALLDSTFGIQVRAGQHCAPRMHQQLGVTGTVRASWGPFSTCDEIDVFCDAIQQLAP